jgi:hypothetical protein
MNEFINGDHDCQSLRPTVDKWMVHLLLAFRSISSSSHFGSCTKILLVSDLFVSLVGITLVGVRRLGGSAEANMNL